MVYEEPKKVNSSEYWYYILPTCILLLLIFFIYVIFRMSSIQLVDTRKVFQIVKKMSPQKLYSVSR